MEAARNKAYLSLWSCYQDEAPYLREWIEFHRLMGVERFYLYDHDSTDDHREALAPYLEEGIVTLHDWPVDPGQSQAANHFLQHHRDETRWVAFLDLDEFLFSPTGRPLPEVLSEYERFPAVVINWAMYGTSGHRTPPDGLVIENYLLRTDNPGINGNKKSILDPSRTTANRGALWDFTEGESVNENMEPSDGRVSDYVSFSRLRINHYHTKSEIEYERKVAKPRADRHGVRFVSRELRDQILGGLDEVRDEVLLRYAPAVREALERTESGWRDRHGGEPSEGDHGCERCGQRLPAPHPQAVPFARDVLMGAALSARDGDPYPHPDLIEKAAALLDPRPEKRPDLSREAAEAEEGGVVAPATGPGGD